MREAATIDLDTVRVGIYMRRSTDDENQPYSIEAQDVRLEACVKSQPGWKIVKKFHDDASGKSTDRSNLQKAMLWAKSGMIDVLLVYRVDRFSRNLRDTVTCWTSWTRSASCSGPRPSRSTPPARSAA